MSDMRNFGPFGLGDYFREQHRLRTLKRMANPGTDPSAGDLIRKLDLETRKSGFEPVGAINRGLTSDEFFKHNAKFMGLEEQLSKKIVPENVSEVLDLVQSSDCYTPTRKVVEALLLGFQKLIGKRQSALRSRRQHDILDIKGNTQTSDGRNDQFLL